MLPDYHPDMLRGFSRRAWSAAIRRTGKLKDNPTSRLANRLRDILASAPATVLDVTRGLVQIEIDERLRRETRICLNTDDRTGKPVMGMAPRSLL
jgi:hypothetical protein